MPKILPEGYGWDSDDPEQLRYERQPIKPIPYLGDLTYYKKMATQLSSTLSYYDSASGTTQTINAAYQGPDGIPNTADDNTPVILIGTSSDPIIINGPIVIPGDVIIRGKVSGRGTIYSGRNVHVIGEIPYVDPPRWKPLERNVATGRIARIWEGVYGGDLGTVCSNGSYYEPGQAPAEGCVP